jgi:hypothetical protein
VKAFLCLCIYVAFFINIFVLCNTSLKSRGRLIIWMMEWL